EMNSKERVDIITDIAVKSDIDIEKFFNNLLIKLDTVKVKLDTALKKFDIKNEILNEFKENNEMRKSNVDKDDLRKLNIELDELRKEKVEYNFLIEKKPKHEKCKEELIKLKLEFDKIVLTKNSETLKNQLKEYKRLNKIKNQMK